MLRAHNRYDFAEAFVAYVQTNTVKTPLNGSAFSEDHGIEHACKRAPEYEVAIESAALIDAEVNA